MDHHMNIRCNTVVTHKGLPTNENESASFLHLHGTLDFFEVIEYIWMSPKRSIKLRKCKTIWREKIIEKKLIGAQPLISNRLIK